MRPSARIAASAFMLTLDVAWVYAVMRPRYQQMIARVQGDAAMRASPWAAIAAYLFMVAGLNLFVLDAQQATPSRTAFRGFLFGLILYGVYDLTCAAVLKDWEINTALLDVAWGGFVFASSAALAHRIDAS